MSRDRRQKASDVFRQSTPFFGGKVPFSQAFPQLEKAEVHVKTFDQWLGQTKTWFRNQDYLGEFFDCDNHLCYNGGFNIGEVLRAMVRERQEELSGTASCQGYEGSPKGRRKYGRCFRRFEYTVKLTYKEQTPASPT